MLNLQQTLEINRVYSSNNRGQEITGAFVYPDRDGITFEYDPADIPKLPIKKEYSPNPGDVLYIGPGCNIPRIKLRDLLLDNHAKTTNDITKASHIFVDTTFQKMVSSFWSNTVSKAQLLQFSELLYKHDHLDQSEHVVLESLIKDLPDNEQINVANNVQYEIQRRSSDIYKGTPIINNPNSSSSYINHVKEDQVDNWKHIMDNLDKVYDYKCLISHINAEDSITIDEKVFQQLSSMFKSEDKDNHVLAMEIMANSNYIESLMYLEILFVDHGYKINDSGTKRHVNFKSLVDFLGKNLNYLANTSSHSVIDSLIEKDVLTLDAVKYIFNKYKDDFYGSSDHFEVKQVTLSDELAKILNVNYIETVREDFVPEVIEEQVVEEKEVKPEEFSWVE